MGDPMPTGYIHLGRDSMVLPGTEEKRHTYTVPWVRSQRSPVAEGGVGDTHSPGQRSQLPCHLPSVHGCHVGVEITIRHPNLSGNVECPSFDPGVLGHQDSSQRSLST